MAMHQTRTSLHKSPKSLRLENAGNWNAPRLRDCPSHKHSYWEIVYYRSGRIHARIGEQLYKTVPGTILITPPGVFHSETARTAYSNSYIGIGASYDLAWPRVLRDGEDRAFATVCSAIVSEWCTAREHRQAMISLLLNQLAILIQRTTAHVLPAELLVRKAEQIMAQSFRAKPSIAEVAREVGASVSSLRAHFARLRKHSPLASLHAMRVEHALTLLRTSDLTLGAVADLCGYDSASHLSRQVKRSTSRTPGQLRGANIAGHSSSPP